MPLHFSRQSSHNIQIGKKVNIKVIGRENCHSKVRGWLEKDLVWFTNGSTTDKGGQACLVPEITSIRPWATPLTVFQTEILIIIDQRAVQIKKEKSYAESDLYRLQSCRSKNLLTLPNKIHSI